jgi:hypothetical protein
MNKSAFCERIHSNEEYPGQTVSFWQFQRTSYEFLWELIDYSSMQRANLIELFPLIYLTTEYI